MEFVDPTGQTDHDPAGIHIPVGSAQPGKGRHKVQSAGIRHRGGEFVALGRVLNQPQLIAQPLDHTAGVKGGAFQRIGDLAVQSPGNAGEQVGARVYPLFAGVHQQKAAGAVCILGLAGLKAALAEECTRLVADGACNGHTGNVLNAGDLSHFAVNAAGWLYLRQHGHGNAQLFT